MKSTDPSAMHFANLSDEQLKQMVAVEKEINKDQNEHNPIILLAYEKQ